MAAATRLHRGVKTVPAREKLAVVLAAGSHLRTCGARTPTTTHAPRTISVPHATAIGWMIPPVQAPRSPASARCTCTPNGTLAAAHACPTARPAGPCSASAGAGTPGGTWNTREPHLVVHPAHDVVGTVPGPDPAPATTVRWTADACPGSVHTHACRVMCAVDTRQWIGVARCQMLDWKMLDARC